ncbi:MAG TPA: prephenate dehydratase [Candidatus Saccharimonadales bacterium]|nr:prephenate dehydratase [Candidatus Saccharimonadales bacterium]
MRVAIQGVEGSYHHIAAESYFGGEVQLISCDSFAAVFEALKNNQADFAIVGAENSIAGTVHPVYDLLIRYNFLVTGEVYEQIHHNLIGLPDSELNDIKRVFSHQMALPQCDVFLSKQLPGADRVEFSDTAASVKHVKELNDTSNAAIASSLAATLYDLPILHKNIEDFPNNVTRFLVLTATDTVASGVNKASCVLETPHEPGALWKALGVLAEENINLSKLESRPIPDKPWRYQFLIDIDAAGAKLHGTVHKLEELGCNVRILGEYAAGVKTSS